MQRTTGPTALILSRQNLPVQDVDVKTKCAPAPRRPNRPQSTTDGGRRSACLVNQGEMHHSRYTRCHVMQYLFNLLRLSELSRTSFFGRQYESTNRLPSTVPRHEGALKGGYTLIKETAALERIIVAAGSEVR